MNNKKYRDAFWPTMCENIMIYIYCKQWCAAHIILHAKLIFFCIRSLTTSPLVFAVILPHEALNNRIEESH